MKNIKTKYKMIFTIIFIMIIMAILCPKSLAVTQPTYAPDGGTWEGWFCAQSGFSYWNKYSYYGHMDDYGYHHVNDVSAKSSDGMYWHMLGYILNYAEENDAKFVVNHYKEGISHKKAGTEADMAVQDAIWKIIMKSEDIEAAIGLAKDPTYSCGCNNAEPIKLWSAAEASWNGGNPKQKYEYKIQVWKDKLDKSPAKKNYVRQPLIKIENVTEQNDDTPDTIKIKFYKKEYNTSNPSDTTIGVGGAKIKVTTSDGTISGTLTESASDNGYFGTLKIKPTNWNDGQVKIKIEETKTPSGYIGVADFECTVKYNKTTGKITSITSTESVYTDTYKHDDGVGIVKLLNKKDVLVKVHFYKWNAKVLLGEGKRLGGAQIDVEGTSNVKSMTKNLFMSTRDTEEAKKGYLGYVSVVPTTNNGTFKIKLKEIVSPTMYNGIPDTELTVKYNKTTGKITEIISPNENYVYPKEVDGKIIVRVLNHLRLIKNGVTLLKTDFDGNPLEGVTFDIYLNNVSYVNLDGILYYVDEDDYNAAKEYQEGNTESYNEIVLLNKGQEKTISYKGQTVKIKRIAYEYGAGKVDSDRMKIFGLKTDENGQIEIPEMQINKAANGNIHNKEAYIIITETETIEGYEKLPAPGEDSTTDDSEDGDDSDKKNGELRLRIKYNIDEKKWYLEERKTDGDKTKEKNANKLPVEYWELVEPEDEDDDTKKQLQTIVIKNKKTAGISINDDASTTERRENITKYEKTIEEVGIPVANIKFTATFSQEGATDEIQYGISDTNGHVAFYEKDDYTGDLAVYYPKTTEKPVTVKIHEEPSENYIPMPDREYKFEYNKTLNAWKCTDEGTKVESYPNGNITYEKLDDVVNTVKITSITLEKKDPTNPSATMNGAKFKISMTNIEKIDGQVYAEKEYEVTGGKIELKNLEVIDASEPVVITAVETVAPTGDGCYYKPFADGEKIVITLKRDSGEYKIDIESPESELGGDIVTSSGISGNKVSFVVTNIPYIELAGKVWIDGQIGLKAPQPRNSKIDEGVEKFVEGVKVYLVVTDGEPNEVKIEDLPDISLKETKTDVNGQYEFKDLLKTDEGYRIYFVYNGILYDDVGIKGDSKAEENSGERDELNDDFKTIDYNGANCGTEIKYTAGDTTSKFQADVEGEEPLGSAITAYTEVYKTTDKHVNCGLLEKEFDLAIGTDVKEAEVSINGRKTIYTYAEVIDEKLNKDLEARSSQLKGEGIVYNLNLYLSDYNYRLTDYFDLHELNDYEDSEIDSDGNGIPNFDNLKELEVEVTYSVMLKNQTAYPAKVDEFVYYYDGDIYEYAPSPTDRNPGYSFRIEENKIVFWDELDLVDFVEDSEDIDITFKVKKDSSGYIKNKGDIKTAVEIVKYSTEEGGLIDRDSRPGNANLATDDPNYEDDTDEAIGLTISKGKERTITGTVFNDIDVDVDEDRDIDGIYNVEDDEPVNDVIVQLIELKEISGKQYEYIWQETRSGSSSIRINKTNGYSMEEHNDVVTSNGQYIFKDFIPGDYIIRFIYGDGRTWDVTDNVGKYNGQEYQSTIDKNYEEPRYDKTKYDPGASIATDNERRRLETMIYTVEVDENVGIAIKSLNTSFDKFTHKEVEMIGACYNKLVTDWDTDSNTIGSQAFEKALGIEGITTANMKDTSITDADKYNVVKQYALQRTWMNADTAKIGILVDEPTDAETGKVDGTLEKINNDFTDMNFGITKRPETKLSVEKHITSLKIAPTGVGAQSIVDARVDISDILDNNINEDTKHGITTGLAIMPSTREDRGFWKVETDVEEIAQGAKLEVEYTYVIKNESEHYYLGEHLVDSYMTNHNNLEVYKQELINIIDPGNTVNKGDYLGTYYYTNIAGPEDKELPNVAKINGLKEVLNNQLTYKEDPDSGFIKINDTPEPINYYNDIGEYKEMQIENVLETTSATDPLAIGSEPDTSRTLKLETTISSFTNGKIGVTIPSYITQMTSYSNAAGLVNKGAATPGNLCYIHSEDDRIKLDTFVQRRPNGDIINSKEAEDLDPEDTTVNGYVKANEFDEFWGETIVISKPTGADKKAIIIITTIVISSIAVIGVGIILIKKHVLKK